jgi:hypothetical protein
MYAVLNSMREATRPVNVTAFVKFHKYHLGAAVLIFFWCLSYVTSGNKIEWGDFSFFAQAYEAMRISILHYHQFPWFNPWVSGGVPLYANPQMGVFSIQMVFVLLFGSPVGLKLALVVYTALGYLSMYLLVRKYFKVEKLIATLLSLIWIFCSFFVAHLPAHFTFAWYMLAPLFIYLCLTVRSKRSGILLGVAFAVMAQSQIHNPFMHITLICGTILLIRLVRGRANWKQLVVSLLLAAGTFIVLAGHRLLLTFQNVHDFPRHTVDLAANLSTSFMGPLLPLSFIHPFAFITYPVSPFAPHGYGEVTATIGFFALIAAMLSIVFMLYQRYTKDSKFKDHFSKPLIVLAISALCYAIAYGRFAKFTPYNIIKHLPVFADMRVSSRWFIFFDLGLLIFIGLIMKAAPKKSFFRFSIILLLCLGVGELFFLNAGYQGRVLSRPIVDTPKPSYDYPFVQTSYFGETRKLSDGSTLPDDGHMPHAYREYEATLHNEGILYANDALVQLALDPRRSPGHPTCPVEEGCNFVRTDNAKLSYWSPNKIVLKRTAPGPIKLNMNNSNYFVINGKRDRSLKVAEPFTDFTIQQPDSVKTITIVADPSLTTLLKK